MNDSGGFELSAIVCGVALAYIIWPIWAISYVAKRGNDSAGGIIFLTSLIGLGPLVALFIVLGAMGKPLEKDLIDHQQRQCPNCGGFKVNGRRANTRTNIFSYTCELCGYKWSWTSGNSWPTVHVRPNLIASGAQKLEDEEKRRQHEQEMAAAAYFLSQQKRKK